MWDAIARVHEMEAWKVLGYTSFEAWARTELNVSQRQSYRYLAKAKASVELAAVTGVSTDEAAAEVPLTPPPVAAQPTLHSERTMPEVVPDWTKPIQAATKLTSSISHLRLGDLPPSAQEALADLLVALESMLRAR